MPVSAGLQKYFDSRRGKKDETQARLDAIAGQIDPAFSQSFLDFRNKILGIIDNHPEESDMIHEELHDLTQKLQTHKRVHNLKKAQIMIDIADTV
jgi:hypothetical protein